MNVTTCTVASFVPQTTSSLKVEHSNLKNAPGKAFPCALENQKLKFPLWHPLWRHIEDMLNIEQFWPPPFWNLCAVPVKCAYFLHVVGLKDLLKALVDLFKNKTYVYSSLALTIKIIFAAALGGFYTKVLVLKFGGTFSEVALYSAAVFIPGNTRKYFTIYKSHLTNQLSEKVGMDPIELLYLVCTALFLTLYIIYINIKQKFLFQLIFLSSPEHYCISRSLSISSLIHSDSGMDKRTRDYWNNILNHACTKILKQNF